MGNYLLVNKILSKIEFKIEPNKNISNKILKKIFSIASSIDKSFYNYYKEFDLFYKQKNILPKKIL